MVHIRPAVFTDYSLIARLQADNWKKYYRGILSDDFLDNAVDQDRSTLWYNRLMFPDKSQRLFIAEAESKIVGFACLYLNEDEKFGSFLDNLHVSDQQQRSGIGKQLMRECALCIDTQKEHTGMYLWVFESNSSARKLYEQMGARYHETIERETVGGQLARVCRYLWEDASILL